MEKSIFLKDRVFLYNVFNQISPFVTNLSYWWIFMEKLYFVILIRQIIYIFSFAVNHRQFAFDLATPILRNDPNILFSDGDSGFSCLISLILDSNHSLSNCAILFINNLYGNCPHFATKIIPYDKVSSLLY